LSQLEMIGIYSI